ncbi:MAG: PAS domain-containing protein [Actinobacteria bacterium]|nr:PAS domain-containing protein [Actinomycetota bacterium]
MIADFTYDWEEWRAPDGSFIYVSPSCETISGYKPEEFIKDTDLLVRITHPDDVRTLLAHVKDAAGHGDSLTLEYRIMCKSHELTGQCHPSLR